MNVLIMNKNQKLAEIKRRHIKDLNLLLDKQPFDTYKTDFYLHLKPVFNRKKKHILNVILLTSDLKLLERLTKYYREEIDDDKTFLYYLKSNTLIKVTR